MLQRTETNVCSGNRDSLGRFYERRRSKSHCHWSGIPLTCERRLMHLSEVVFRWIVSFILIYDVHRNVESRGTLVYFLRPREVAPRATVTSPILRNILIHERYRARSISQNSSFFAEAMSYHLRINDEITEQRYVTFRIDARSASSRDVPGKSPSWLRIRLEIDFRRTEVNRRYRLYSAAVLLLASNPPQYFDLTEVSYNREINLSRRVRLWNNFNEALRFPYYRIVVVYR